MHSLLRLSSSSMGLWSAIVLSYFATHIPATLIIDSQAALPLLGIQHPQFARDLLAWYCQTYADPCMCTRPAWFTAIVWVELLLQLPFFFVVLWAFPRRAAWLRIPMIAYGAHVATTLVPIYGALFAAPLRPDQLHFLAAVYAPYLLIPLVLLWYAARDQLYEESSPSNAKKKHSS